MIDLPVNVREIVGAAGGLAGVGDAGQIAPMPTAADVGAVPIETIQVGTWTPTLLGSGGGNCTYSDQTGNFINIGKLCFAQFRVSAGNVSTLSGSLYIGGLPYASAYWAGCSGWVTQAGFAGASIYVTTRDRLDSMSLMKFQESGFMALNSSDLKPGTSGVHIQGTFLYQIGG